MSIWKRFRTDAEVGATMLEYGLMVALVAMVVLLAVGPLGLAVSSFFDGLAGSF